MGSTIAMLGFRIVALGGYLLAGATVSAHDASQSHTHEKPPGVIEFRPAKLEPGKPKEGWSRATPMPLSEGILNESPSLAVLKDGRVVAAWVQFDSSGHREKILWRAQKKPSAAGSIGDWNRETVVFEGPRAWRPRLVVASNDSLWVTWCGSDQFAERGNHRRKVFLRRLLPESEEAEVIVEGTGRECDPVVAADPEKPELFFVWESSDARTFESKLRWARHSAADGKKISTGRIETSGQFERRPSIQSLGQSRYAVAWDRWVDAFPTGQDDPDYDVFFTTIDAAGKQSAEVAVAKQNGIQAAPSLILLQPTEVGVLFHSSVGHSLVKHSRLRQIDLKTGKVSEPILGNEVQEKESRGEMQGSEFPVGTVSPTRGTVFASRPSQGFYLHRVEGKKIRSWDLTLGTWSARGITPSLAWSPDGETLWVARRGAREALVERIDLPKLKEKKPRTRLVSDRKQKLVEKKKPRVKSPFSAADSVYFGDVHMHSAISDASGAPDEVIARAYTRGLDFAALTDHDTVGGSRMLPSEYAEISWLTDVIGARPDFVALHAYEWTTPLLPAGSGHRNVYFEGYGPPEVYTKGNGHGDTRTLYDALKDEKAFAVPHHTPWTGTDWENFNEKIQRHFEVVSVHGGADEPKGPIPNRGTMEGMYGIDGLKKGLRYGFIAGSDGHGLIYHHGIARHRDPWAHGLTGVIASQLERRTVWNALYERKTFGTSGSRIEIYLRSGRFSQGEAAELKAPWKLDLEVRAPHPVVEVAVFRNGEVWKKLKVPSGARTFSTTLEDTSPPSGAASYFVRAIEKQPKRVEAGWSSPIFLSQPVSK